MPMAMAIDRWDRPTSRSWDDYVVDYLRDNDEFMVGTARGLKALADGKYQPWSEVKQELGLG